MAGTSGGQNIDYNNVSQICAQISSIAGEVSTSYNIMMHNFPSTVNEGKYATSFASLRSITESMTSDIKTFMDQYASLVMSVASNYADFDAQMGALVDNQG